MIDTGSRRCGFCNHPVEMTVDTDKQREYRCHSCNATETIIKGKEAGWWYCGWKRDDGAKLRVPTSEEMQSGVWGWQPDD